MLAEVAVEVARLVRLDPARALLLTGRYAREAGVDVEVEDLAAVQVSAEQAAAVLAAIRRRPAVVTPWPRVVEVEALDRAATALAELAEAVATLARLAAQRRTGQEACRAR